MVKFFIRKVTSDILLNMACFNGEETHIELGFGCEFGPLSLVYSKNDKNLSIYYGRSTIMGDTVYRLLDTIESKHFYNADLLSEKINNKILQFLFDELEQTETIKETDEGYEFECEPLKIDFDESYGEIFDED